MERDQAAGDGRVFVVSVRVLADDAADAVATVRHAVAIAGFRVAADDVLGAEEAAPDGGGPTPG